MLNVAGSKDIALSEVTAAAEELRAAADKDVNLTFGASFDPSLDEEVVVTVIATGMTSGRQAKCQRYRPRRRVSEWSLNVPPGLAGQIPVTGQSRRPRTGRPKLTPPQALHRWRRSRRQRWLRASASRPGPRPRRRPGSGSPRTCRRSNIASICPPPRGLRGDEPRNRLRRLPRPWRPWSQGRRSARTNTTRRPSCGRRSAELQPAPGTPSTTR